MIILAIDPAPTDSAYVVWDTEKHDLLDKGIVPTERLITDLQFNDFRQRDDRIELVAIEMIQSYGQGVGRSIFETCLAVGRMKQASVFPVKMFGRPSIKSQVGGRNDTEIRASLRMRYGDARKGEKLEGIKRDLWSALALAVALEERPTLKEW